MWVAERLLFVLEFFICVFFCMLLSTVPFMVKKEKSNWKNVFYRGGRGRGVMVLLKNVFMLGMPAMNLAPHINGTNVHIRCCWESSYSEHFQKSQEMKKICPAWWGFFPIFNKCKNSCFQDHMKISASHCK